MWFIRCVIVRRGNRRGKIFIIIPLNRESGAVFRCSDRTRRHGVVVSKGRKKKIEKSK